MKPCKGIGKAKDFIGCGHDTMYRTHGLCSSCYATWLHTTPEGKEKLNKTIKRSVPKRLKPVNKSKNKRIAYPEVYKSENKRDLQNAINKLARLIDMKYYHTCIDCGGRFGKQIDGSHFHNVNGHENIRFNLHNIHAARQDCNQHKSGNKRGYYQGLIDRYGEKYAEHVDIGIPKKYPYLGLTGVEIAEKLKIVRRLIRKFDTFDFLDAIDARNKLNDMIGIY